MLVRFSSDSFVVIRLHLKQAGPSVSRFYPLTISLPLKHHQHHRIVFLFALQLFVVLAYFSFETLRVAFNRQTSNTAELRKTWNIFLFFLEYEKNTCVGENFNDIDIDMKI